jgi:hypothetical protein
MRKWTGIMLGVALMAPAELVADRTASLRGSPASMQEQNRVARDNGLSFFRTPAEIRAAVERGELVKLEGNENYAVADFVVYPYLHPDVALFIERISAQYREACGQRLVVTSGVRPMNGQPSNAHSLSVHPAGMAVDLRVSDRAACRSWLEASLMNMERQGLLNGIREFRPPHYHVAVYPDRYRPWAEERMALEAEQAKQAKQAEQAATRQGMETLSDAVAAGGAALAATARSPVAEAESGQSPVRRFLAAMLLAAPLGIGYTFLRGR